MADNEVVIISAVRTAIGTFNGSLANIPATKLGAIVIKEAIRRSGIKEEINEVIMGNVLSSGLGQNPARQSALEAGLPNTVPSMTINKVCGSGLKAVHLGAQSILLGDADAVVVGGMENMSQAPYLLEKARTGYRMGDGKLVDSMIRDGLWCAMNDYHMGTTAENLCSKYNITREEQDEFSEASHKKAIAAIENGIFQEEIVPVEIPKRKAAPIIFDVDEHPKQKTTTDTLSKLRPAFKKDGSVTAGNSSGINDGAAAMILTSRKKAKELGITPLATIKANATAAVDPSIMGIGPVPAVNSALQKGDLSLNDIGRIEANEAFAAQTLAVNKELGFDLSKVNVNGGAVALGHPIGASGARILVTLLHEMRRQHIQYGLATLCVGGGQGVATIVENGEK